MCVSDAALCPLQSQLCLTRALPPSVDISTGASLCVSLNPSHLLSLYFLLLSEHTPRRVNPSFLARTEGSAQRNPTQTHRRSLRSELKTRDFERDVTCSHFLFFFSDLALDFFFCVLIPFLSLKHKHLYSSQKEVSENLKGTQMIKAKSALSELIFYYPSQSAPDSRPK